MLLLQPVIIWISPKKPNPRFCCQYGVPYTANSTSHLNSTFFVLSNLPAIPTFCCCFSSEALFTLIF